MLQDHKDNNNMKEVLVKVSAIGLLYSMDTIYKIINGK